MTVDNEARQAINVLSSALRELVSSVRAQATPEYVDEQISRLEGKIDAATNEQGQIIDGSSGGNGSGSGESNNDADRVEGASIENVSGVGGDSGGGSDSTD